MILAFRLNMELFEKFFSFFVIINYNGQALIEKRNFIFFAGFLFFLGFFFLQLTLFYWRIVIKIATFSREIYFFKGFFPFQFCTICFSIYFLIGFGIAICFFLLGIGILSANIKALVLKIIIHPKTITLITTK